MSKHLAIVVLTLFTAPLFANEQQLAIVEEAFPALDNDFRDSRAFTETTSSDDGVRIARYNQRGDADGSSWTLISVDGRAPSDSEGRKFRKDKLSKDDDRDNEGKRHGMAGIRGETLELVEETDDFWVFAFVPADDGDDDFMRHVDGRLRITKHGRFVEHMRLENRDTIRPAFGVKISRFVTDLRFAPAADSGPVVPHAVDVEVRGRAYLAVGFEEVESIRYDGYEFVGAAQ